MLERQRTLVYLDSEIDIYQEIIKNKKHNEEVKKKAELSLNIVINLYHTILKGKHETFLKHNQANTITKMNKNYCCKGYYIEETKSRSIDNYTIIYKCLKCDREFGSEM